MVIMAIMVIMLITAQVSCIREYDQYIPSLWVMCLESVAHLLVMLNVSSNFLIYCSVSSPFKKALSKACWLCWKRSPQASSSSPPLQIPEPKILPTDETAVQEMVSTIDFLHQLREAFK